MNKFYSLKHTEYYERCVEMMIESFGIRKDRKKVMKALSIHKQLDMLKIYTNEIIIIVWLDLVYVCLYMKLFDELFFFLNEINSLSIDSFIIPMIKNRNASRNLFKKLSIYFFLCGVNAAEVQIIK